MRFIAELVQRILGRKPVPPAPARRRFPVLPEFWVEVASDTRSSLVPSEYRGLGVAAEGRVSEVGGEVRRFRA